MSGLLHMSTFSSMAGLVTAMQLSWLASKAGLVADSDTKRLLLCDTKAISRIHRCMPVVMPCFRTVGVSVSAWSADTKDLIKNSVSLTTVELFSAGCRCHLRDMRGCW